MQLFPLKYVPGFKWRGDGFNLEVVERRDNVVLVHKTGGKFDSQYTGYEVALLKPFKAYSIAGKSIPAGEQYPTTESWGTLAWTYRHKEDALAKFKSL